MKKDVLNNEASLVNQYLLVDPKHLTKAIFEAELPEQVVREIPPLNLYMAIQNNSLISSTDLIDIMTTHQRRVILDLDCWEKDEFNEARFFNWLSLTDENNSLDLLKKIFASSDLKLVAFLIGKYVTVHYQTEPTAMPPDGDFYTPDKGYTWIKVDTNNNDYDFLLKRLLALIFETSIELFYQIISVQTVSTSAELEEEALREKNDRLASEGIPTFEESLEINRPITKAKIIEKLKTIKKLPKAPLDNITPLSINDDIDEPLKSFIANIKDIHTALSELSRILNAGIVFYEQSFDNLENMYILSEQIKGILNIGLERLLTETELNDKLKDSYPIINLQDIYRYGLSFINDVRNKAIKILNTKENPSKDPLDSVNLEILTSLSGKIPYLPLFVKDSENFISDSENKLIRGKRALRNYNDIETANKLLKKISSI